jgi:flagellar FliL protein
MLIASTKITEEQAMAEEQKQQKVEEAEEPQGEGKKKNLLKLIILAVLFLVLVGGGAVGYFFYGKQLMQKYLHKKSPEGTEQAEQTDQKEETEKKKEVVGPILSLEPFIFNMSGNQSKYAKVTLGIEFKDPKIMEEAKKMMPVIRDRILSIFGTKAPEVLMDVNQRNTIKEEIQTTLRTLFPDSTDLRAVYITDIIIQ